MKTTAQRRRRVAAGFTLVEVLVALFIMALLAGLAWQGLAGVLRARDESRVSIDATTRLATVLTQWQQDLQSVTDTELVPPLSFDGQTLRMTRRTDGGVQLVAWSVRSGVWQRWSVPPITRAGALQEAWLRSQQLQGSEPGHLTVAEKASTWQVYFARGGRWGNAQSTGDLVAAPVAPPPPPPPPPPAGGAAPGADGTSSGAGVQPPPQVLREAMPDAVRMVITLDGKTLTRDIALGPAGT